MSEDWAKVAAEVDDAIKSVGSTDAGYPITLRRTAKGTPANPWDPPAGTPTYTTMRAIESNERLRDINGTLIGMTRRTLTVGTGAGVVPAKADKIAIGIDASAADENSDWQEIAEVRPLSPAGAAVLYEIDLVT